MKKITNSLVSAVLLLFFMIGCAEHSSSVQAEMKQDDFSSFNVGTYGLKIYNVNSAFYPFVMVYFRTMDIKKNPLVNLTPFNMGLMVEGKAYDHYKKQFYIETLKDRTEGIRTTFIIDCSASMWGQSFSNAITALNSYIKLKAPSDEIAVIAITNDIEIISPFTKDKQKLELLVRDLKPTGSSTRLYDAIARAIQMSYTAPASISTDGTEYTVLHNIVALTDGIDTGSLVSHETVLNKLLASPRPIPIYALGYSSDARALNLSKLMLLTEASYGRFWTINDGSMLTRIMDEIISINRHDYVLTFRSYLPVDGKKHNLKVMVNYEGRVHFDSQDFETMEVPLFSDQMRRAKMSLDRRIPLLGDNNPYLSSTMSGLDHSMEKQFK